MPRRGAPLIASFLLLVLALLPSTAARSQESQPPVFGAATQVVLLDLVARDSKGRPVSDLRADELQVFENGQRCEVQSFRVVRAAALSGAGPKASAAQSASAVAAPPNTPAATNEPSTPSRANLVVLLFDRMLADTAPYAREGGLSLLGKPFPPNTWFAVFKVHTRGTIVLQPFTADQAKLTAAVLAATTGDDARVATQEIPAPAAEMQSLLPANLPPADSPAPPDAAPTAALLDAISARVRSSLGDLATRVQAFDTLYGLQAIARSLEPVRGRKTILYLAVDRQLPDSTTIAYDSMVSAANRANVTIHTVDVRGLSAARVGGMSAFDQTIGALSPSSTVPGGALVTHTAEWTVDTTQPDTGGGPKGDSQKEMINNPGSSLERMANDTGGLSIRNTNDLGAGLVRVTEELSEYYEIVYAPPDPTPDGRFRRIQVKVGRAGVKVRTRSGYFATPASAPTLLAYELLLTAALAAAEPPHDFGHSAGLLHFGGKGGQRETMFLACVPLGEVGTVIEQERHVRRAHLQFLGYVKDTTGRAVARLSQDWPIEVPLQDASRLRGTTAVLRRRLTLPAGRYLLETALRDAESRRLSVERASFEVPGSAGTLALGSLAVVRQAAPVADTASDPLHVGGVAIEPYLGTAVLDAPVRELPLYMPVYGASAGAQMELELWRAGERVARTSRPLPPPEPDGRIAWIGSLPAKSLGPGRYELVARVLQDGQQAEERALFEIREPAAMARAAGKPAAKDGEASRVPQPVPADLAPILQRAGQYVLDYEQKFQNIVAEETYTQWAMPLRTSATAMTLSCSATSCKRTTRGDIVFARLAGAIPWGCFRDVFEVDGNRVRPEEGRLEALFTSMPSATAQQRARILLDESARYNIGPALRNINFPTLALVFLHPSNQGRFAWKRGGKRWFGDMEAVEVSFEEVARPTLVDQGGRGDLPAKGRFWIDPARGTVARSEARFEFEPARARAYVAAEYRPEPKLALWVPAEMREEYDDLPGTGPRVFGTPSEATARYANYRRFSVTTDETASVPDAKQR